MPSEPSPPSYSSRREAVSWTFEMLADAGRPPSVRIRRAVLAVRAAAGAVGAVEAIRWSVAGAEDFAVVQAGAALDAVVPPALAGDGAAVVGAMVELGLHVDEPGGRRTVVPAGAAVFVASDDDGSVFLVVRLRTGAYADRTPDGDNRPVAALNRGRLRAFLSSIVSGLALRLDDLEPGYYAGQVDEHGFVGGTHDPAPAAPAHAHVAALVGTALTMTEERLATAQAGPARAVFGSIRNQLVFMRDLVADGRSPTTSERNSLSLGVIAVREFETDDLAYCDAICDAVLQFKRL